MSDVIYLVTSGSYSDYSVDAAFTSKERADAWIATHSKAHRNPAGEMAARSWRWEDFEIEKRPLDPVDEELDDFAASLVTHPVYRLHVYPLIIDGGVPDLYASVWVKGDRETVPLGPAHAELLGDISRKFPSPVPDRTGLEVEMTKRYPGGGPLPIALTFTGPDEETVRRYARDIFARHRAEVDTAGTSWLIDRINQAAEEANALK